MEAANRGRKSKQWKNTTCRQSLAQCVVRVHRGVAYDRIHPCNQAAIACPPDKIVLTLRNHRGARGKHSDQSSDVLFMSIQPRDDLSAFHHPVGYRTKAPMYRIIVVVWSSKPSRIERELQRTRRKDALSDRGTCKI